MIRLSLRLTWPLALLILFAVLLWLLHRASQAQAQPAATPINRAHIINMSSGDTSRDSIDTIDLDREVWEAVRQARAESPYAETGRNFRKNGEKRARTTTY